MQESQKSVDGQGRRNSYVQHGRMIRLPRKERGEIERVGIMLQMETPARGPNSRLHTSEGETGKEQRSGNENTSRLGKAGQSFQAVGATRNLLILSESDKDYRSGHSVSLEQRDTQNTPNDMGVVVVCHLKNPPGSSVPVRTTQNTRPERGGDGVRTSAVWKTLSKKISLKPSGEIWHFFNNASLHP